MKSFFSLGEYWKAKTITCPCLICLLHRTFRSTRRLLRIHRTVIWRRIYIATWCGTIQKWNQKVCKSFTLLLIFLL